jgi:cyclase
MLRKRIIPSLLLKEGRCVKGVKFTDHRDVGNPVTAAKVYDAQGADELLFLDITASREKRDTLFSVVEETAENCFMPLTVGGGVKTIEDIRCLLLAGADKVLINTAALERPDLIRDGARQFGDQCVVVGIDFARGADGQAEVVSHAGAPVPEKDPVRWAKRVSELGAGEIVLTSFDREGTREGYDLETTQRVVGAVPIPVIAAGGAGSLQHLADAFQKANVSAVSVGSIFHFTDQSVIKARAFLNTAGVNVRPYL